MPAFISNFAKRVFLVFIVYLLTRYIGNQAKKTTGLDALDNLEPALAADSQMMPLDKSGSHPRSTVSDRAATIAARSGSTFSAAGALAQSARREFRGGACFMRAALRLGEVR